MGAWESDVGKRSRDREILKSKMLRSVCAVYIHFKYTITGIKLVYLKAHYCFH